MNINTLTYPIKHKLLEEITTWDHRYQKSYRKLIHIESLLFTIHSILT